ncbi:ATP synthase subunit I [Clostridium nigeriense]|uniref:ATP synthase subunit I n=1 Tax=Clostridium nigeriense TaxID=1805470 RepID=UPI003D353E01
MSNEMKRLLKDTVRYDIIFGLIFSLILSLFLTFKIGAIFFLGTLIALINFTASGVILEYCICKNKKLMISISYFIRIAIVLIIASFFINDLKTIMAYIIGYIFHFVLLTIYWIRERKGSD